MTLHQLEQYRDQRKELEQLKRQIGELSRKRIGIVTDVVQASLEEFPYTKHTVSVTGTSERAVNSKERLQRIYRRRRTKLEREQLEVEQWIAALEDSKLRQIVTMRYVQGDSWRRVGSEVYGSALSEDAARKRVERFFENIS